MIQLHVLACSCLFAVHIVTGDLVQQGSQSGLLCTSCPNRRQQTWCLQECDVRVVYMEHCCVGCSCLQCQLMLTRTAFIAPPSLYSATIFMVQFLSEWL